MSETKRPGIFGEQTLSEKSLQALQRYIESAHGVQAAIAFEIADQMPWATPEQQNYAKHQRVGIDVNIVDISSIGQLLVHKGICTSDELYEALARGMEIEKEQREAAISKRHGFGSVKFI